MMPNFPSLKMRSFGHSLKGKRQKVPHFLLLFFCKNQSNLSSFFVRTGALQTLRSLQMLRSATNAPELYKSSGGLKIPLQRLRLLLGSAPRSKNSQGSAPALQPELKMPYAPLRSAPAPERSESLLLSTI